MIILHEHLSSLPVFFPVGIMLLIILGLFVVYCFNSFCVLWPMMPMSLDCPFLIVPLFNCQLVQLTCRPHMIIPSFFRNSVIDLLIKKSKGCIYNLNKVGEVWICIRNWMYCLETNCGSPPPLCCESTLKYCLFIKSVLFLSCWIKI